MNIDSLTIGEAKELIKMFGSLENSRVVRDYGLCIVVLDRGFIYVGHLSVDGDIATISGAKNVRRWGTERGLGQLALEGPQPNTKLDNCPTVTTLTAGLKHWIKCEESSWKNY